MSDRFVVWLSTNPVMTWVIKNVASRLDPVIFKATNGRFTSMGAPTMPMLTMTATGRSSPPSQGAEQQQPRTRSSAAATCGTGWRAA